MKKLTLSIVITLSFIFTATAQNIELEKWTYEGATFQPLGNVPSLTGTESFFGDTTSFWLAELGGSGLAVIANFANPPSSYLAGVSHPSYTGSTTGGYKLSFDISEASFTATGSGKALVGWGLRSNANASNECTVLLQYSNNEFQLIVNDKTGTREPITIASGSILNNLNIAMIFDLDKNGDPGSFFAYYTLGSNEPVELFSGQLATHTNFEIGELRMEAQFTSPGFSWGANDYVFFDNLLLESSSFPPLLTFVDKNISLTQTNGVIPGDNFEPGDIIQIITTNKNETAVTVTDVSTSLYADPSAFKITATSSNYYPSLGFGKLFTGTYRVEILDGATNGPNTFTVENRINSSSKNPIVYSNEM